MYKNIAKTIALITIFFGIQSAFADSVDLPIYSTTYVHCTVIADKHVNVHVRTHSALIQGGCYGPYVYKPGKLTLPTWVINSYSFRVEPEWLFGAISVDTPYNTPVNCVTGDDFRPEFAYLEDAC